jgi:predicted ATP-grasp superfamily ATP-dependent carboligase
METRMGMVACRLGGGSYALVFEGKDIVVPLYLLAMLISMRAVNVARLVRAYVKDHPQNGGGDEKNLPLASAFAHCLADHQILTKISFSP